MNSPTTPQPIDVLKHIAFLAAVIEQCGTSSALHPSDNAKIRRTVATFQVEAAALSSYCARHHLSQISQEHYSEMWPNLTGQSKYEPLTSDANIPMSDELGRDHRFPSDARAVFNYAKNALGEVRTLTQLAISSIENLEPNKLSPMELSLIWIAYADQLHKEPSKLLTKPVLHFAVHRRVDDVHDWFRQAGDQFNETEARILAKQSPDQRSFNCDGILRDCIEYGATPGFDPKTQQFTVSHQPTAIVAYDSDLLDAARSFVESAGISQSPRERG